MKTTIILFGVLAIYSLSGCGRKSAESSTEGERALEIAPHKESIAEAPPQPNASKDLTEAPGDGVLPIDPISASTVWEANEATDWNGKWIRQGSSNVFDIYVTNKWNGENRHHVGTVAINGNEVTASHPDGTTYKGRISADRMRIDGIHMWNGLTGNWTVRIDKASFRQPVAVEPRPAPDGIYFLLQSLSVTTDSGIVGLHPGTQLRLIRDDGPTLHVVYGDAELDVSKTAVTNDFNVAEAAFTNDLAAQASLVQWKKLQADYSEKQESARQSEVARQHVAIQQNRSSGVIGGAAGGSANPLDKGVYNKAERRRPILVFPQSSSQQEQSQNEKIKELQGDLKQAQKDIDRLNRN